MTDGKDCGKLVSRARLVVSRCLAALAALLVVSSAAAGNTSLLLDSEPGDSLGVGQSLFFTPADGTFQSQQSLGQGVSVVFRLPSFQDWALYFGAPIGQPLTNGTYDGAVRLATSIAPGLDVTYPGVGCGSVTGRFDVIEAVYGTNLDVVSFRATFEQFCSPAVTPIKDAPLWGEIRFNATMTIEVTAPHRVSAVEGQVLTFQVSAVDVMARHVTLSAAGLPAGATFTDHGDNTATFDWTPAVGQAGFYRVRFNGDNGAGNQDFAVAAIIFNPVNDDFDNAIIVNPLPFQDRRNTRWATAATDDTARQASVWYRLTPNVNTQIIATTAGSGFDASIGVFTGSRGSLTWVGPNYLSPSSVLFPVQAGVTYSMVVYANGIGGSVGGPLTFSVAELAPADLSISMNSDPSPPIVGSNVTYSLTISNQGPGTATGIALTDTLPPGQTFVSAPDGCTTNDGVVTCEFGMLPSGVSTSVVIVAAQTGAVAPANRAHVVADQTDPNPINNTAVSSPDVVTFGLFKGQVFAQGNSGNPKRVGGALFAGGAVDAATNNTVSNAQFISPDGAYSGFGLDPASGDFSFLTPFRSKQALNAAFPSGDYTFVIDTANEGTKTITLSFPPSSLPKPPHVNNWIAAETLNATADFVLAWDAFVGAGTNDSIVLSIDDNDGNTVFMTPDVGEPGTLDGRATTVLIPANTLAAGTSYVGTLLFAKSVAIDTASYPGVLGVNAYVSLTIFPVITAIGPTAGPGAVQLSSSKYAVNENGGVATLTVVRTGGSTGPVTVDFATSDSSATAGSDYTATSGTLSFADGETAKTFTVSILDDKLAEPAEKFRVTLSNPTGGVTLRNKPATVTILNDD